VSLLWQGAGEELILQSGEVASLERLAKSAARYIYIYISFTDL
jgi:hypothetical protein